VQILFETLEVSRTYGLANGEAEIMAHVKSMSNVAKRFIDEVMSDGVSRNSYQIIDELYNMKKRSANRHIPTKAELHEYLSKNYSRQVRRERHPLSLNKWDYKQTRVTYYWKEASE